MRYQYTHTSTQAGTGYFSCIPAGNLSLNQALACLAEHPLDDFMRRYILNRMEELARRPDDPALSTLFQNPALQALLAEAEILGAPPGTDNAHTAYAPGLTSLIYLKWNRLPDRNLQRLWVDFFTANQRAHRIAAPPEQCGLPPLYTRNDAVTAGPESPALPGSAPVFHAPCSVALPELRRNFQAPGGPAEGIPPAAETAALALERLEAGGFIAGQEMRHTASLSPIALLRPWNVRLTVSQGRHNYSLEGQATTYGRGLSLDRARVSCLMEMVERASAYVSVAEEQVLDRAAPMPLLAARRSELLAQGHAALDPNDYPIEAPYQDERLHWISGFSLNEAGMRLPVLVPLQMAALFCNLDEMSLYDAPGSTGLGGGPSPAFAMRAALLEILERDAEAVSPYSKSRCFTLTADDPADAPLRNLLRGYAARGINVQFQDLSGEFGLPAYKCFVLTRKGNVAAGFGANLSARAAILSALTETPFPFPDGGPSGPVLRALPAKDLAELPDYSLGHVESEWRLLDALLRENNRTPVYVDLTRADLGFPVLRALVPGLELAADRDGFSRVPGRLYANYLNTFRNSL